MDTSFLSEINWLAVLVATLVYFMLGALWYSKPLFGSRWATLHNIDMTNPDLKKGMGALFFGSFILMLIATIGLAILVVKLSLPETVLTGIKIGLLAGICFAATSVSISFLYQKKPTGLHFIDGGYHVVGMVAAAIILVMWR